MISLRYAVRFPDGDYLSGKGSRWSLRKSSPRLAAIWLRPSDARRAAEWFKRDAEVVALEVPLP